MLWNVLSGLVGVVAGAAISAGAMLITDQTSFAVFGAVFAGMIAGSLIRWGQEKRRGTKRV
jgi:hypothetical protein